MYHSAGPTKQYWVRLRCKIIIYTRSTVCSSCWSPLIFYIFYLDSFLVALLMFYCCDGCKYLKSCRVRWVVNNSRWSISSYDEESSHQWQNPHSITRSLIKRGAKRLDMKTRMANFPIGSEIWAEKCELFLNRDMQPCWQESLQVTPWATTSLLADLRRLNLGWDGNSLRKYARIFYKPIELSVWRRHPLEIPATSRRDSTKSQQVTSKSPPRSRKDPVRFHEDHNTSPGRIQDPKGSLAGSRREQGLVSWNLKRALGFKSQKPDWKNILFLWKGEKG